MLGICMIIHFSSHFSQSRIECCQIPLCEQAHIISIYSDVPLIGDARPWLADRLVSVGKVLQAKVCIKLEASHHLSWFQ